MTPTGRIINRFAKELFNIDSMLPFQVGRFLSSIFNLLAIFAAVMFASPYLGILIVVLSILYLYAQYYYRHTSIELQRLEALTRSPIYSQLGETIHGVASIRAYEKQSDFISRVSEKIDVNTTQIFSLRYCSSFFGLVLDLGGGVLVMAVMLVIVLLRNYAEGSIDVGFAGIAVTYLAGMTLILSSLNIASVDTETQMNSVERIKEYEDLVEEAPEVNPDNRPPKDWPTEGRLEFKDYSLAYREGELVLKNISLDIESSEKIGIVGRTGAGKDSCHTLTIKGKSSLIMALFRMVEPANGTIVIDNVDIRSIGLRDLRSKLSIIPQEPTLFIGTVRYNLDPFEEASDTQLWEALKRVRLSKTIRALPGKLDALVSENGGNFSVGERQLLSMARALLRNSKILLMDEATASVDLQTDQLIQKMVRKNFKDSTVLTIAHRLPTIMDSTRVVVLSKGEVAEVNAPSALLEDPDGMFNGMVEATGAMAPMLRRIAYGDLSPVVALKYEKAKEGEEVEEGSSDDTSGETSGVTPRGEDKDKKSKEDTPTSIPMPLLDGYDSDQSHISTNDLFPV